MTTTSDDGEDFVVPWRHYAGDLFDRMVADPDFNTLQLDNADSGPRLASLGIACELHKNPWLVEKYLAMAKIDPHDSVRQMALLAYLMLSPPDNAADVLSQLKTMAGDLSLSKEIRQLAYNAAFYVANGGFLGRSSLSLFDNQAASIGGYDMAALAAL